MISCGCVPSFRSICWTNSISSQIPAIIPQWSISCTLISDALKFSILLKYRILRSYLRNVGSRTMHTNYVGCAVPALSGLLNLSRTKSIKPVFHVPIFETSIQENCLGELWFKIKTLKVTNLVISTPLASSGVKSNQQSILNYHSVFRPLLQQSTIIPVQPELILLTLVNWYPRRTLHSELRTSLINLETP